MIDDPESRLGRYLVRNWERVALVGGESLVYWLRKLVFRGAWLDHQVKRGALEVVWDDDEAEFAYQHPGGGGRPLLELAPVPSWHELQFRARRARRRPAAVAFPRRSRSPCRARRRRRTSSSPSAGVAYLAALLAVDHYATYPEQLALGVLTWLVLLACADARPAWSGARRRSASSLFATIGEVTRLAHLGRLQLPAAQPAALRPAGARARLPDRARRSRSRSRRHARAGRRGRRDGRRHAGACSA